MLRKSLALLKRPGGILRNFSSFVKVNKFNPHVFEVVMDDPATQNSLSIKMVEDLTDTL